MDQLALPIVHHSNNQSFFCVFKSNLYLPTNNDCVIKNTIPVLWVHALTSLYIGCFIFVASEKTVQPFTRLKLPGHGTEIVLLKMFTAAAY